MPTTAWLFPRRCAVFGAGIRACGRFYEGSPRNPAGVLGSSAGGRSGDDPVRVVVAEDVMLTRAGIVRLLPDADVDVVAEAEDADGLLRHVRLARPDVAI